MNSSRDLRNVVRIHEQRITQFVRCTGKRAQDQYAAFIFPGSHKFLGHQVHPIVQGSDHAEGGRLVETGNFLVGMVFPAKHDGLPPRRLEAVVDALRLRIDFLEQIPVAVDVGPAGRADLHEGEPPAVTRIQFEKPFQGAEPLQDSFGVIDTIHPDSQMRSFNVHLVAQFRAQPVGDIWFQAGFFMKLHANRVGPHSGNVALAAYRKAVPFGERFETAVHGFKEIVAMGLNMEADEIRAQQSFDEFALPRANSEDLCVGPGDVPEDSHARVRADILHHARNECKMIVLRQQNGRIRVCHFLQDGVGKPLVDPLVLQPVFGAENWARMGDMAKRPEALIRKSIVIAFVFLFRKPDATERITRTIRRDAEPVLGIDDFAVRAAGATRDPCAVARQQNRLEGGDHAAGGHDHLDVLPVEDVHVGLTIRNHKKRLVLKPFAKIDAQPFRGPQRGVGIAEPRFDFGRRPCRM